MAGCVGRAWGDVLPMVDASTWKACVTVVRNLPSVTKPALNRYCDGKNWGMEASRFFAVADVTAAAGDVVAPLRGARVQGAAVGRRRLRAVVLGSTLRVIPWVLLSVVEYHGFASRRSLVGGILPMSFAGEGRGLENKDSKVFRKILLVMWETVERASVTRRERVACRPKSRKAKRSSAPLRATAIGPPIVTVASRNRSPK